MADDQEPDVGDTPRMHLTLFVGGKSAATESAVRTLERLVEEGGGSFTLEVVNVHEQPERAEEHRVLATPTLIRELPPPVRRLIGDLSRHAEVRLALDLSVDLSNPSELADRIEAADPNP